MKIINVFYHVYLCDNINKILHDQLEKLIFLKNSADKINFFVNLSPSYDKQYLDDRSKELLFLLTDNINFYEHNHYELSTLKLLYNHAKEKISDELYLYIHTKGATRLNSKDNDRYSYKNVENWRKIMEHFCIDNWKICIEELKENDLVGCNYICQGCLWVPAHFSGNFWWSKSSFIRTLEDPQIFITDNIDRFHAEFWIGRKPHKSVCLFPIPEPIVENHNRCFIYTDKKEYENNIVKQYFINL